MDTSGQDSPVLCDQHIRAGQGFICVYAIYDIKSFEVIPQYIDRIARIKESKKVSMILVENKADLSSWTVMKSDLARNFAKQQNMPFFVTSALSRAGMEQVFVRLVNEIGYKKEEAFNKLEPSTRQCCIVLLYCKVH